VVAAAGRRVIAWEPVPRFLAFFRWAVAANGLSDLITIHPRVISDQGGKVSSGLIG
jgi:hypothetical protein